MSSVEYGTCNCAGIALVKVHDAHCPSRFPRSVVRRNLLTEPGYSPYCGTHMPAHAAPRTRFDGEQFACPCGFRTEFEPEFIAAYKAKWGKP